LQILEEKRKNQREKKNIYILYILVLRDRVQRKGEEDRRIEKTGRNKKSMTLSKNA
jgi:hypothetical protein